MEERRSEGSSTAMVHTACSATSWTSISGSCSNLRAVLMSTSPCLAVAGLDGLLLLILLLLVQILELPLFSFSFSFSSPFLSLLVPFILVLVLVKYSECSVLGEDLPNDNDNGGGGGGGGGGCP